MSYICEKCVYSTNLKKHYDSHLLSKRHQDIQNETTSKKYSFICKNCNKGYSSNMGLYKHNKICKPVETKPPIIQTNDESFPTNDIINKQNEMIVSLIEKVDELSKKIPDIIQKPEITKIKNPEYIYLLQEREFVNSEKSIYKLGKSKQDNTARVRQYPKGSILLFQKICNNCDANETELIKLFNEKYVKHSEIGNEYFEGNVNEMMRDIFQLTDK
jgi:hypothetical protein